MSPSALHVAILDQLIQPKVFIKIPSIMTPSKELISVSINDHIRVALTKASEGPFDQLPVLDNKARIVGLVYMDKLQGCSSEATVSDYLIPLAECKPLRTTDGISKAVRILHTQPANLVVDGEKVVGLVHRSDLNKHPARTYFYLWLSALEMGLARLVALRLPDNAWVELLGEQAQIQVLGKMEFESRRNNSIAPSEYLDLSDLVGIIKKNEPLQRELGFDSRSKLEGEIGGLVQLRHTIMHPVRTLVSGAESMNTLVDREKRLRAITLTVQRILKRA